MYSMFAILNQILVNRWADDGLISVQLLHKLMAALLITPASKFHPLHFEMIHHSASGGQILMAGSSPSVSPTVAGSGSGQSDIQLLQMQLQWRERGREWRREGDTTHLGGCQEVRQWSNLVQCEVVRVWGCEEVRVWGCEVVRVWGCEMMRSGGEVVIDSRSC